MVIDLLLWILVIGLLSVLYIGATHWLLSMFFGGIGFLVVGIVGTALTESEEYANRRYLPMAGLGMIFVGVSVLIGTTMTMMG